MSDPTAPHDDDDQPTGPTEPLTPGDPLAERPAPDEPAGQAPGEPAGQAPGEPVPEASPAGERTPPAGEDPPHGGGPEQPAPEPPPTAEQPRMAASTAAQPRRLTRSSTDKVLGGVAGGLGRYFDIDPIIFRIGFVILTFAGGAGVLAYLAAWLLVPRDPVPGAAAPADRSRTLTIAGGVVLAIAALAFLGDGFFFVGPPLLGLGLLAVVGLMFWRMAGGADGDGNRAARRIGLGILLLVVAAGGFVAVAVGAAVGGGSVIAGLVIAVGIALAISAFLGGARWLVLPALVLAVPLGFVASAGIDVDGGVGDRDYHPTTTAEVRKGFELGIGELRIDMRDVDLPVGRTPLHLDLGIGSIRLLVPEDVCVASEVRVGAGHARVLNRESNGLDVDWRQSPVDRAGVKRLVIDAEVGLGEVQVVHDPAAFVRDYGDGRLQEDRRDFEDVVATESNAACMEAA